MSIRRQARGCWRWVQAHFGLTFELFAYAGVFFFIVYNILRLLITSDSKLYARAPFIVEIPGSALPSGNISIVLHGLIFLCGRWFSTMPVLLLPIIAAAAIIKPTFEVYLALFLFLQRPVLERFGLALAGVAIFGGYFVWFSRTDYIDFANWRVVAHFFGIVAERGNGFLGMPVIVNISDHTVLAACYGIFALVIPGQWTCAGRALPRQRDRQADAWSFSLHPAVPAAHGI